MLTVLVVDDSMIIRNMVKRTMENVGATVLMAEDGLIGLDIWRKNKSINVVLTDINMPNMDGYQLVSALRKEGCSIPILCLTTESRTDRKEAGRAVGADGWMVKPFDPSVLVNTIIKVLEKKRGTSRG